MLKTQAFLFLLLMLSLAGSGCVQQDSLRSELAADNPQWDSADAQSYGWEQRENGNYLYLNGPGLYNLSALRNVDITSVFLINSDVRDLDFLTRSASLRKIAVMNDPALTDISALQGKPLERVGFYNTPGVSDFSPLYQAPLQLLSLVDSQISSIAPFSNLHDLRSLLIRGTAVAELEVLRKCEKLDTLDIARTPVKDLSPLSGKTFRMLELENTPAEQLWKDGHYPEIKLLPKSEEMKILVVQ